MVPEQDDFERAWQRVREHERQFFRTRGGRWFTYRIEQDFVCPSQAELRIPRAHFELAYPLLPFPTPGKIARFTTGPEYIWGILHDERVSQGRWITPARARAAPGSSDDAG